MLTGGEDHRGGGRRRLAVLRGRRRIGVLGRRRWRLGVVLLGLCAMVGAGCGDMATSNSAPEPSASRPSAVADDSPAR